MIKQDKKGKIKLPMEKIAAILFPFINFVMACIFLWIQKPTIAGIFLVLLAITGFFAVSYVEIQKLLRLILGIFFLLVFGLGIWLVTPSGGDKIEQPPSLLVEGYDFEDDTQGWGEHPEYKLLVPGQGVEAYRDKQEPISKNGEYSLKFTPTEVINNSAYVSVRKNTQGCAIETHIYVPSEANINTPTACSTAKIIIWDKNKKSHESDFFIELSPGSWQSISWDVSEKRWPGPWPEFGIHFWFITDYRGPIYIDNVTLTK